MACSAGGGGVGLGITTRSDGMSMSPTIGDDCSARDPALPNYTPVESQDRVAIADKKTKKMSSGGVWHDAKGDGLLMEGGSDVAGQSIWQWDETEAMKY